VLSSISHCIFAYLITHSPVYPPDSELLRGRAGVLLLCEFPSPSMSQVVDAQIPVLRAGGAAQW
jgi:hypothetical protein